MLKEILKDIDNHKDDIVEFLCSMIETVSSDGRETQSQEIVLAKLNEMGFETESFKGIDERCLELADYCDPGFEYDENTYNVAGVLKGKSDLPGLMLFGHIDTESEDYFGHFENPYQSIVKDGRIYGLGSSDDKGGIAMMLCATEYVKKHMDLNYDLTLMSILGKHGGAFGTLTALMKGYTAENSIYLHPAETGHGFAEIKNISLGVVDLDICVTGKNGMMHDDLDTGVNSNVLASKVVTWLEELNQINRKKYVFDFGSFKGLPSYVLNVGSVQSDGGYGGICQKTTIKVRTRFFMPLTIDGVMNDVVDWLKDKCETEGYDFNMLTIEKGNFRATPCMIENDDPFVKLIEQNITDVTGINEFIHQYHGGSDIRLPIVYGNSKCVGIGPTCILPEKGSNEMEWISIEDYIQGVKILASILVNYEKNVR